MDIGPPPHFWTSEPRLGFGGWALGGSAWGPVIAESDRLAAVARALERGVTFFDTAPSYGNGTSETLLGRALAGHRPRVAIATKVGPRDDPTTSLHASLGRLRTDYVDLLQLHELGERWEWQLETLVRLREAGAVRAIGLCNATHLALARAVSAAPLATYQGLYNVFDRDAEERELPFCQERGLAFLAVRPLASGLLSGKYRDPPAFVADDHRGGLYWFRGREFARRRAVLERLEPWGRARGLSLAALALAWVLARRGVSIALVGAKTAAQVDENLAAAARLLAPDEVAAVDAVVAEAFRPARATARARALARDWGPRERHIVEGLDGSTSYETIAARWTDRGEQPMIAAQVKVFCDRLADEGLVE
ncbi:MAG TPA: aldo/keto reductase [Gemmatimonadales bacterium]|nr:aldo/keto reductase [Gemmatimonadales bacterium]